MSYKKVLPLALLLATLIPVSMAGAICPTAGIVNNSVYCASGLSY